MRIRTASERKDQGFTLIELLVVVVIIGILAAIAIPVFLSQREKAADSATKSDLKNAATFMETYFVDNQTYDGVASTDLDTSGTNITLTIVDSLTDEDSFCIDAVNTNGSEDKDFSYNSAAGGLQETACVVTP